MSAAHTSASLAARLHRLAKDLPGFEYCDAGATTTVYPSRTTYRVTLILKVKPFLRTAEGRSEGDFDNAVTQAFEAMNNILATYRRPALKQAPTAATNHQSKAA